MRRRPAFAKIASSLVAALLLAGCGQFAGAPAMVAQTGLDGFAALADFANIDAQIAKATLEKNFNGTLVSKLPVPEKTKPVTFLTYKALDNNLGVTLPMHLNILEKAGSSTNINALAFTDDIGPKNTFRYYIRKDTNADEITSPYEPAHKNGDMNTGAGETLRRAIKWGFTTYPGKLR